MVIRLRNKYTYLLLLDDPSASVRLVSMLAATVEAVAPVLKVVLSKPIDVEECAGGIHLDQTVASVLESA
jgi:hypothetical protein